jgi:Large polyvalent protein-associated domain 7
MDTDSGINRRPGGSVEPANRGKVAREVFQMPKEPEGPRYELRDPFAEVTYRVDSLAEMVTKADRLGATRFTAIAADGSRTPVAKIAGEWRDPDARVAKAPVRAVRTSERGGEAESMAPPPAAKAAPEVIVAKIDTDAERAARVARLEAALFERYVIKRAAVKVGDLAIGQTEYRYRGDANRVAFTETTFRLATDNNNPSVARSMIDVAEARNWQALRVSGNEDFKRMVWLEASLRGVKALGYEPQLADQELLKRESAARAVNRIEPALIAERAGGIGSATGNPGKQSARGSGGRKAVLSALEAVLISKGVPTTQRDAVMAAAADNLAKRLSEGQVHKVKVFDKSAPSKRVPVVPTREIQHVQDRQTPIR